MILNLFYNDDFDRQIEDNKIFVVIYKDWNNDIVRSFFYTHKILRDSNCQNLFTLNILLLLWRKILFIRGYSCWWRLNWIFVEWKINASSTSQRTRIIIDRFGNFWGGRKTNYNTPSTQNSPNPIPQQENRWRYLLRSESAP